MQDKRWDWSNLESFRESVDLSPQYHLASSKLSREYSGKIHQKLDEVLQIAPKLASDCDLLVTDDESNRGNVSAKSEVFSNNIIFGKSVVQDESRDLSILLIHELMHLRIASKIRETIRSQFPEIFLSFNKLIEVWQNEGKEMPSKNQRLVDSLKDSFQGQFLRGVKSSQEVIDFLLKTCQEAESKKGSFVWIDLEKSKDSEEYKNEAAVAIMELGDYVCQRTRDDLSHLYNVNLWEVEEGINNLVAAKLCNIPIENNPYPQDLGKIAIAKKLEAGFSGDVLELADNLQSYEDIIMFLKKYNII